jgi:threonine dehydrogenase-like Zn-dependent dehydrogenase
MQYWDADTVLRMILSKRIQIEDIITNEFSIDDFKSAYQVVRDSPDALCVALRWV